MKNIFKALKFTFVLLFVFSSFIACDKDFATIESDVLGEDNADFTTPHESIQITSYNKKLDSLQTNRLASYLLGVYNDPAYGQTTANIVSQIVPTAYNPDFGNNPSIDSVVLRIPYYFRNVTDTTYTIKDSLFGNSKMKLYIFKNSYFLRNFDPNQAPGSIQNYYAKSDGTVLNGTSVIDFENFKGTDTIYKNEDFTPSNARIILNTFNDAGEIENTEYQTPALRVKLDTVFWRNNILNKEGQPELSSESSFKNYFRGLYFKSEAINNNGSMILLNMASTNANITIYYSKDSTVDGERTQATYTFNFNQNIVNTLKTNYTVNLQNGDKNTGDDKLYVKGTLGSMAVVDLFTGTVPYTDENNVTTTIPALEAFKKTYRVFDTNTNSYKKDSNDNFILKRLINDAQLSVYEDETIETGNDAKYHKYDRLYAYDIKNNTPTIDYLIDPIENSQFPYNSKIISLGQRKTDDAKYKIRLTEHLNNILLRDSTNTKIGIVLSNNVNYTNSAKILNSTKNVTSVPAAAIISPRGTILHGTNSNVAGKKMKLEIYYTEPKK